MKKHKGKNRKIVYTSKITDPYLIKCKTAYNNMTQIQRKKFLILCSLLLKVQELRN